ncbi:hypothetical protein [Embleya sp. NBC_00896]|uniref:hypothetical protein n=1 Tax=Embleya sp. NBC_00896 TaxID=2975961 RepID=UPI002F90D16B|nr:hypothetical protein OG928_48050 [Embleya sp. NBC_00896]
MKPTTAPAPAIPLLDGLQRLLAACLAARAAEQLAVDDLPAEGDVIQRTRGAAAFLWTREAPMFVAA